jgi:hypothetical protein
MTEKETNVISDLETVVNSAVRELLKNLSEVYTCSVRKYSQGHKVAIEEASSLKLEIVHGAKGAAFLRLWATTGGQTRGSRYNEFYECSEHRDDWKDPEDVGPRSCPDSKKFASGEYLTVLALEVIEWVIDNGVVLQVAQQGVTFEGTTFEGYGERDFMAAIIQVQKLGYDVIIPGVGNNLGFEYELASTGSRVDAVEFNEAGEVITVIEAQSGLQHGNYLDDDHFAKAIGRYPYSPEIQGSVRRVIVIAGGYYQWQIESLKAQPFDVILLRTERVDNKVTLVPVV